MPAPNAKSPSGPSDENLGMIPADTLNPQKARILLMLALKDEAKGHRRNPGKR
jgi:L-asparaginase/Glu-tRNA(Gln) amidotransferase subunit D